MKIEQLQPGMTVYNVQRRPMGNTTLKTTGVFSVYIKEVDMAAGKVLASWNGNTPQVFRRRAIGTWRKNKPVLVSSGMGSQRLATREELQAMKAKETERIAAQTEGYFNIITAPAKDNERLPVAPQLHVPLQKPIF